MLLLFDVLHAFAGGRRMRGLGWTENTGRGSTRSDPESLIWNEGNLRKCCKRVRMWEGRRKSLRGASAMKKRWNSSLSGEIDFWLNWRIIGSSTHFGSQGIWLGLRKRSLIENFKVQYISSSLSFLPAVNPSFTNQTLRSSSSQIFFCPITQYYKMLQCFALQDKVHLDSFPSSLIKSDWFVIWAAGWANWSTGPGFSRVYKGKRLQCTEIRWVISLLFFLELSRGEPSVHVWIRYLRTQLIWIKHVS